MMEKHHIWGVWARTLHEWGLESAAAWLLESTRPLHVIGAQLVHIGQPLLSAFIPESHSATLAEILEEPGASTAFVRMLREGEPA